MWIGVPFLKNADTRRLALNNRRYWPIVSGHFFGNAMTRMTYSTARAPGLDLLSVSRYTLRPW
jgi:hypothetical protein